MERKIVAYEYEYFNEAEELNDYLKSAIESGWQPFGNPIHITTFVPEEEDFVRIFGQAIVRYAD